MLSITGFLMKRGEKMDISVKKLDELSSLEFFEIVKKRIEVFVVEQNCPYQEVDDEDVAAHHVILKEKNDIAAYARIMEKESYIKLGRVLVTKAFRGQGLGYTILKQSLKVIQEIYPGEEIHLSAQAHLVGFYGSQGFKVMSDVYLEDDIPHVDMVLTIEK